MDILEEAILDGTFLLNLNSFQRRHGHLLTVEYLQELVLELNKHDDMTVLRLNDSFLRDGHAKVLSQLKYIDTLFLVENIITEEGRKYLIDSSIEDIKFGEQCSSEGTTFINGKGRYDETKNSIYDSYQQLANNPGINDNGSIKLEREDNNHCCISECTLL